MTESVSGFFAPEERAAKGDRLRSEGNPPPAPGLSLRVLHLVAAKGSVTLSALLAEVEARPRAVVAAVDDLEAAGLVTVEAADREEIVRPTEAGLSAADG